MSSSESQFMCITCTVTHELLLARGSSSGAWVKKGCAVIESIVKRRSGSNSSNPMINETASAGTLRLFGNFT